MEQRARITRAGAAARCAYCRGGFAGREARRCAGCGTCLHADCLAELGACPTLGCVEPAAIEAPRAPSLGRTLAAHPLGYALGHLSSGAAVLATFLAVSALTLGRRRRGSMSEQAGLLLFWFGYALGWTAAHGVLWRPQLRTVILAWIVTALLALLRDLIRSRRGGPEAR